MPRVEPCSLPGELSLSVVVLTRARRDLLCRTLDAVLKQDVPNLQVIVVDNASPDGTVDFVRERYPGVELLALSDNVGIRGRNEGFRAARGDVIVSLDDDIELDDRGALRRIRDRFAALPDLGAVSLRICDDPHGTEYAPAHWWHPVPRETHQDVGFETDHINEAAVALRRTALEEVGGYYEPLFWGGEEWDLCLGLMDAGYRIQYLPETVRHLAPRGPLDARADPRHALLIRNRCWIAIRRLPFWDAIAFTLPRLVVWGGRSIRHGYFRFYLAGLWGLVRVFSRALRERRVVSKDTILRLRRLHAPLRDVSRP